MNKYREEFESAYEPNPHKSPFTEVRFNQDKRIYEPLNPPLDYIARSLNAAWYGWRIRQKQVDFVEVQLSLLRDKNKAIEIELTNSRAHADALQAKLDACQKLLDKWKTTGLKGSSDYAVGGAHTRQECEEELEQALRGGEV